MLFEFLMIDYSQVYTQFSNSHKHTPLIHLDHLRRPPRPHNAPIRLLPNLTRLPHTSPYDLLSNRSPISPPFRTFLSDQQPLDNTTSYTTRPPFRRLPVFFSKSPKTVDFANDYVKEGVQELSNVYTDEAVSAVILPSRIIKGYAP
jgi:hypothetical protein